MKSGLKVNQASRGKKIIGTARPGKSSGFLTERGRETDIGIIMAVNERIETKILKTMIFLFLEIMINK
jgi:hypothetical protein